jgi:hypothetical protein
MKPCAEYQVILVCLLLFSPWYLGMVVVVRSTAVLLPLTAAVASIMMEAVALQNPWHMPWILFIRLQGYHGG